MPVWPSFLEGLGERDVFARIDVGYSVGDRIEFVNGGKRESRLIVRKEPVWPAGWVLLEIRSEGF